jgi:hypothetical protein
MRATRRVPAFPGLAASDDGALCVSISRDGTVKVFDVLTFDMIVMMKLPYVPGVAEWLVKVGSKGLARAPGAGGRARLLETVRASRAASLLRLACFRRQTFCTGAPCATHPTSPALRSTPQTRPARSPATRAAGWRYLISTARPFTSTTSAGPRLTTFDLGA